MKYGSVCSGIEAATAAWHPLGWEAQWFSEIEAFPSAVLAHHYPTVPNVGDFTHIAKKEGVSVAPVELLVGGTPCQSFSVAGKRLGLDDPRGNLALEFLALAYRTRPRWVVFENVPGLLSSAKGEDFAAFLSAATGAFVRAPKGGWRNSGVCAPASEAHYGVAYRVLDAQYFGVPQRRRRVFAVLYLGDWRPAAAVLFERESLRRNTPPRRKAGQRVTGPIADSSGSRGWSSSVDVQMWVENDTFVPEVAQAVSAQPQKRWCPSMDTYVTFQNTGHGYWKQSDTAQTIRTPDGGGSMEANIVSAKRRADGHDASEDGQGRRALIVHENKGGNLTAAENERSLRAGASHSYQFVQAVRTAQTSANGHGVADDVAHTLDGAQGQAVVFEHRRWEGKTTALDVSPTDPRRWGTGGNNMPFVAAGVDLTNASVSGDLAGTLEAAQSKGNKGQALYYSHDYNQDRIYGTEGAAPAHNAQDSNRARNVLAGTAVRRLTPVECERLQGFPDGYTKVPFRGKPAADGPRYKAIGNSMAVPVMAWIGRRIALVDDILHDAQKGAQRV